MTENEIAAIVVDTAIRVHKALGPGLLESVYKAVLRHELLKAHLEVEAEVPVPVVWDSLQMDMGFRADLIAGRKVLLELKSLELTAPVHKKQVLTYLRLLDLRLGLLLNFGAEFMRDGVSRIVNGLED